MKTVHVVGFALCLITVRSASAQTSANKPAADALFDEGKRLLKDGKLGEACPKLAESQRLDPAVGTLLFLGQCYEKSGKTASAWSTFREAASAAKTAGQTDRERGAREHVAQLEPTLSRVTVVLASGNAAPDERVEWDGAPISQAVLGTPFPVDPGDHVIAATAPGRVSYRATVHVEGAAKTTTVEVPALPIEANSPAVASAPSTSAAPVSAPPTASSSTPVDAAATSPRATIGLVTAAVGVVGLGLSAYFAASAKSSYSDSRRYCNDANHCVGAGDELVHSARSKGNVATGLFIAGAVLAGVGTTVWLTAPSGSPQVGLGPGLVAMRGTW